jgi:hypothetical protein
MKRSTSVKKEPLADADSNRFNYALQLCEKGLIKGEQLLNIMGFDGSEELARCKPAERENIELVNAQRKADIIGNKIEQARRNVEVLTKTLQIMESLHMGEGISNIVGILNMNLEVLKEVTKI